MVTETNRITMMQRPSVELLCTETQFLGVLQKRSSIIVLTALLKGIPSLDLYVQHPSLACTLTQASTQLNMKNVQ